MALTVFVDPSIVDNQKRRDAVVKACSDIKVKVDFVPQRLEKTISWHKDIHGPQSSSKLVSGSCDVDKEVIAVLEALEAANMINIYFQRKRGEHAEGLTLTEWVDSVLSALPGKNLTVIIVGMCKFFSKQKLNAKHKYRELVTGEPTKGKRKATSTSTPSVTTEEAEEVYVDVQLETGCIVQHVDTDEQFADQIKMFTKAVADKADKKDRFESAFSFLEEGAPGLSVSRTGDGLAKVWKRQLMQFKNFGAEMAEAVQNAYPSPIALHEACSNCTSSKEAEQILGDINVRRNASIISTNRKIGKEHSRRIHTFVTSTDPNQIVK